MAIFLCSDWHFNHDQEFIWKERGFNSVTEMNEEIVKRHNEVVKPEDEVYVLGDLCMGTDIEANKKLIESMNGNLHIVLGNHDTVTREKMYLDCKNVFEICGYATLKKYKKYTFYLSHYPTNTSNYDDDKHLRACTINLCGHTHTGYKFLEILTNKQLSYHVDMEAHSCYPINLDDIIEDIKGEFYNDKRN